MDTFEPQSMISAIESGDPWAIAGVCLLGALAVFRAAVEPRLGPRTRELTSTLSASLAVLGTAWALGAIWWHGLVAFGLGALLSSGFYRLLGSRYIPAGLGGLLALTLVACAPEDRGLIVGENGVELHAAAYPVLVTADPEWAEQTRDAVEWLAQEAVRPRPCGVRGQICVGRAWAVYASTPAEDEVATVRVVSSSVGPDAGAVAEVWAAEDGTILEALVYAQPDWTEAHHLRHELGHAVIGLDDDEDSLDLGSIMSSPNTPPDGVITDHDHEVASGAAGWLW